MWHPCWVYNMHGLIVKHSLKLRMIVIWLAWNESFVWSWNGLLLFMENCCYTFVLFMRFHHLQWICYHDGWMDILSLLHPHHLHHLHHLHHHHHHHLSKNQKNAGFLCFPLQCPFLSQKKNNVLIFSCAWVAVVSFYLPPLIFRNVLPFCKG